PPFRKLRLYSTSLRTFPEALLFVCATRLTEPACHPHPSGYEKALFAYCHCALWVERRCREACLCYLVRLVRRVRNCDIIPALSIAFPAPYCRWRWVSPVLSGDQNWWLWRSLIWN